MDLGGRGIRSITEWKEGFLIVAGSHAAENKSSVYLWKKGDGKPEALPINVPAGDFNPEAVAVAHEGNAMLLVSDDGTLTIGNTPCKELKDKSRQQFRAILRTVPGGKS